MDAKKCDRCGRFYEEYGKYKIGNIEYEVKKSSMIKMGAKTGTGKFLCENQYDLCPICMDELNEFLTDPNAFQCLGNCNECENRDACELVAESELLEDYKRRNR